jgi:hypothetical protein
MSGSALTNTDGVAVVEFRGKVFMLAHKLVKDYGRFLERFIAKYGEEETEEFLKWLNTLEKLELEAFIVMDDNSRFAYWDAKEHPLERKRLRGEVKEQLARWAESFKKWDALLADDINELKHQINELVWKKKRGLSWFSRLNPLKW